MDKLVIDNDTCMKISLEILKNQREKLCNAINDNPDLEIGLYQDKRAYYEVYFAYYIVDWLLNHWVELNEKIENYSNDDKQKIQSFFSGYCYQMYNKANIKGGAYEKDNFFRLLGVKKSVLDAMRKLPDEWEKRINKIKLLLVKNKKRFEKEKERLKKEGK